MVTQDRGEATTSAEEVVENSRQQQNHLPEKNGGARISSSLLAGL